MCSDYKIPEPEKPQLSLTQIMNSSHFNFSSFVNGFDPTNNVSDSLFVTKTLTILAKKW